MSNRGIPVHGEAYIDGDASGGIEVILYSAGSVTVYTLAATEYLHVTDIFVQIEAGGDYAVVANSDAAGRRLRIGNLAVNGGDEHHYQSPFVCPQGVVPKFFGVSASAKRNVCIIEGFVVSA
jgi:hypothetical protein